MKKHIQMIVMLGGFLLATYSFYLRAYPKTNATPEELSKQEKKSWILTWIGVIAVIFGALLPNKYTTVTA